jgi:[protein-PII] uridylyltransferase
MAEVGEGLRALERMGATDRYAASSDFVKAARDTVRKGYAGGANAGGLLRGLSDHFDRLVAALYRATRTPSSALVSLVALGGYGRGELFPFSDLDLLILYEGGEDELSTRLVAEIIYPLWDAKVAVGYAVRGLEETLRLATDDLTVCTSLLDARMLAGNEGPYHALCAAALREFFGPKVQRFLEALRNERAVRHRRFGETVYLLEPNIKLGKGGLRDLNTGLWAAKAGLGVADLGQLASAGGGTARQVKALVEAQDFLRTLRLAMHLHAGRSQDHLLFEIQETLAPRLFPEVEVLGVTRTAPGVEPAVERLMHVFYRHARNVVLETEGLLQRCSQSQESAPLEGRPVSDLAGEHFVVAENLIMSREPARFWDEPTEILRAFRVALDLGLPLHWQTCDLIAEAAADAPGRQLQADAGAADLWLGLLCDPERTGENSILIDAHGLGVIDALIPEFGPCTGRIQHDLYHVYTVDLHSLYVVSLLKAWRRGDLADRYPTAVALMREVDRPESLFLAGLLHDVGKPLGHGHAAKGARLAVGVAARLGLGAKQQEEVRCLVAEHLTMAHLSQRRDLSDSTVIRTLAEQVGTVDLLRRLYLLTLADTAMTAPGNLTEWKDSLLEELYMRAYLHLSHGEGVAAKERERLLLSQRAELEASLRREQGDAAAAMARRVPAEMLLACSAEDLLHHLGVALELEAQPSRALRVVARRRNHATAEVTLCCWDSPGRLATITGVMLAHRIDILAAQVYTVDPAEGSHADAATVLDIFTVRAPEVEEEQQVWAAFAGDLERSLRGTLCVPELVKRHTRPSGLPPRVVPRVEIVVSIDNDISERLTVIDVQAPDRIGVLYAITRSLSEQNVAIHLSKVATEAGRVVDIFYVSDRTSHGKVTDEARLGGIRGAVLEAIEALARS